MDHLHSNDSRNESFCTVLSNVRLFQNVFKYLEINIKTHFEKNKENYAYKREDINSSWLFR